jgi:hypothetical protein
MDYLERMAMHSPAKTAVWTAVLLLIIAIVKLAAILLTPYLSNMRDLPGPPGGSWITGHIDELNKSETDRAECHLRWIQQYGHVYVYKSLLNVRFSPFTVSQYKGTEHDY